MIWDLVRQAAEVVALCPVLDCTTLRDPWAPAEWVILWVVSILGLLVLVVDVRRSL